MGAQMVMVIETSNLGRRFDDVIAVDRLNLQVSEGEIFGLVGPDGAGKTTTLRLLSGLLDPSEGHVTVAGYNVARDPDKVKDCIGYMAQRFGLYNDLTTEENMIFYADLFGISRSERDDLMGRLLKMTRMAPFRKREAGKLSGGMKQKLALMCTLLHHPKILLLDEPTNGVDPVSRRDFWTILYQLVKDGMTVVIATAYLDEAERCNRVGLMHQGSLIRCDQPDVLRTHMDELCYEVRSDNPRSIQETLRQSHGVVSVEPAGSTLHLFIAPAETSPEALSRMLEQNGLGGAAFNRIVPTLEDTFIALIRKTAGEETGGNAANHSS